MLKAIIAAKNQNSCDAIADIVMDCGFPSIKTVQTGLEVREKFTYSDFELVIIYAPLEDEFGLELVSDISKISSAGIIVITKADNAEEVQNKIASAGAFVLSRPVNKAMLSQSVRFAMLARDEMVKLKTANEELQQRINDIKLIDRAKCVLIQYLRISEAQAHRHIQKQAMDQRVTQMAVARDILKTYESYES